MTNRSQKSGQRTAICHFSFIIGHWSFAKSLSSAVVRKNVAPASSRQTVLLTQKELSRLTCRRDAGATILSHDLRLCGEGFWVAAMPICVHLCSSVFICGFILRNGARLGMHRLVPKSIICLREGYTRQALLADLGAGVTVGIVALPLAMAFAIASGLSPERGIFTAIMAGLLISALGGSRVQLGGPPGAFVVIVYGIVQKHGYEGLALGTLVAGGIFGCMGRAGLGST